MKIQYTEFISHLSAEIDLSHSRLQCAQAMANAAKKTYPNKRVDSLVNYFLNDSGMFHAVRDIIEDIKTDDFRQVTAKFTEVYPQLSQDWKQALKTGLSIKAGAKVGNYSDGAYIYTDSVAQEIREAGINFMGDVIEHFWNQPKTIEQAIAFIYEKTGHITTASKNGGSMKNYTTFRIKGKKWGDMRHFDPKITYELRKTFPSVNKESGLFMDADQIDILNYWIIREKMIVAPNDQRSVATGALSLF